MEMLVTTAAIFVLNAFNFWPILTKLEFSGQILVNPFPMQNFIKFRPAGKKLFNAGGPTSRYCEAYSRFSQSLQRYYKYIQGKSPLQRIMSLLRWILHKHTHAHAILGNHSKSGDMKTYVLLCCSIQIYRDFTKQIKLHFFSCVIWR